MDLNQELIHKDITDRILHAALEVHRALGPGLLESTYECCLFDELSYNGVQVSRQVAFPVHFKGRQIDCGYRIDLLVEGKVIIEVKSVDLLLPVHTAQLLTYMRLANKQVGLLLNFNVKLLMDGIVRRVLSNSSIPSALSAGSAVNDSATVSSRNQS